MIMPGRRRDGKLGNEIYNMPIALPSPWQKNYFKLSEINYCSNAISTCVFNSSAAFGNLPSVNTPTLVEINK